ncbi:unnamed protein product [Phaedon cochleariae]|uniref:Uncharacterized protein n=1 Tax=Phaedon cochleariae TaxID=80249 RepID=A0A9N9SNL1_PHACE|nr:unnamed protein product [Phaedon cochleariae]
MPVDSMHSTIESFISKKTIYAPSMWSAAIRLARHNPQPYCVYSLNYKEFDDYSTIVEIIPNQSNPIVTETRDTVGFEESSQNMRKLKRKRKDDVNQTNDNRKKNQSAKGKPLQISKVQIVEMEAEDANMLVWYSYIDEFGDQQIFTLQDDDKELKKCYTSILPISAAKYKDLMELCKQTAITSDYYTEYETLPHAKEIIDVLPDTDEEDEV